MAKRNSLSAPQRDTLQQWLNNPLTEKKLSTMSWEELASEATEKLFFTVTTSNVRNMYWRTTEERSKNHTTEATFDNALSALAGIESLVPHMVLFLQEIGYEIKRK